MVGKDLAYCRGCDHLTAGTYKTCDYIVDTGHRRPCRAGDGCTCHTKKKKHELRRV